jgi:hypothetical protein
MRLPPYGYLQSGPKLPGTLTAAVALMVIGGGLEALGVVIGLASENATGDEVFGAALGAGLWFLMATMNRRGKSWARIAGTALFAIDCLLFLLAILVASIPSGSNSNSGVAITLIISSSPLLQWPIGLSAVILLWLKSSSAYFAAMSGTPPVPPAPTP